MSDNIQEPKQQAELHFRNCYQNLFCKINLPQAWQEICQACQLVQDPLYITLKGCMWFAGKGVKPDKIPADRICREVFPPLLLMTEQPIRGVDPQHTTHGTGGKRSAGGQ